MGFVETTGKTLKSGTKCVRGMIRHSEPLLCAIAAYARWMVVRFTHGGEQLAVPGTPAWFKQWAWPGKSGRLSYAGDYAGTKDLFEQAGVMIAKVTHAHRIYAARHADEQGLDDDVSLLD